MTTLSHFFKLLDADKPSSIPLIEKKSKAEKAIDDFLRTKPTSITSASLDALNKTLSSPSNEKCLDAPKLYEEYLKNKKAIEQLIQCYKTQPHLLSFEKMNTMVKMLLKRNNTLVESSLTFSEKRLTKMSDSAGKLLANVKPTNLEEWSKVTDALYGRIDRNRITLKSYGYRSLRKRKQK